MVQKEYYSTKEVATIIGVSTRTVFRYIKEGIIHSLRRGKKGAHRIHRLEIPTSIRNQSQTDPELHDSLLLEKVREEEEK